MTRAIYWTNIPAPYMVDRFNAIARRGVIEFEAWFNAESEDERSWAVEASHWEFRHRYSRRGRTRLHLPFRELREARPDVLVSLFGEPSFLVGVLGAKAMRQKVALHAMRTWEIWVPRRRERELIKHGLFRLVDGFYVPGPDAEAYVRRYGVDPRRIHVFAESVDVAHFRDGAEQARRETGAREEAGLSGCVFLHAGRLRREKGLDELFAAYRRLRADGVEASLLLVGDGHHEARYRAMAHGLPGVVFAGFVQPADLPRWYGLADVLVFPTLGDTYGYVVEEGMAASLPVIASDHAGEIRVRLREGETGFVVPAGDPDALYERMKTLAAAPILRRRMGAAAFEAVRERDNDWWAARFEEFVTRVAGH